MPAQQIRSASIDIALYDVLGFDSPQLPTFVGHIALASRALPSSQQATSSVRVTHIAPPLLVDAPNALGQCHGTVGLDESERPLIEAFARQLRSEYKAEEARRRAAGNWDQAARARFRADQYTIRPHVRWPNEERPYHQLSCAGFVYESYAEANIFLVDISEANLPPCNLESLMIAYAPNSAHLHDITFRVEKGLDGDGPWPILLPGYVINALDRSPGEIRSGPYRAVLGDECFPRAQAIAETSS